GAEQLRLFREVSRACVSLAQRHPTLLLLEDLHWADCSTLDLLQHVVFAMADAAMSEPVPLLIVVTYRPVDAYDRLERTIARLRREDIALRLGVPGLDEAEIDGLIRGLGLGEPTHQLVTTVSATTRGNPLFIQELLHHLVKHGALRRRGGYLAALGDLGAVRLPKELTSVIGARTRPLESRCRRVLEYASLLRTPFSPRTPAAVSA